MKFSLAVLLASVSLSLGVAVEPRQSQRWNDRVIAEPREFKATKLSNCVYQLAYRRDNGDGRYNKRFEAINSNSRRTVSGTNSANNFQYFAEYIGDLNVFYIRNACTNGASGTEPTSFRVHFSLPEGQYTYVNNWSTDAIPPTAGPVPSVPRSVTARRETSRKVRVSWQPVAGAAGYLIKSTGLTDSEVGDVRYWTSDTISGGSTNTGIANGGRIDKISLLAYGSDGRLVSDFTVAPIVSVTG